MVIHSSENDCKKSLFKNLTFSQRTLREISRLNRTSPLLFKASVCGLVHVRLSFITKIAVIKIYMAHEVLKVTQI